MEQRPIWLVVVLVALGCSANIPKSQDAKGTQDDVAVVQAESQPAARSSVSQGTERFLVDAKIEKLRTSIAQCGGTLKWDKQGRFEVDLLAGRATADGAAIDALRDCPDVRILRARLGKVSVDQLLTISTLTELQELMLQDAAIDDNTLIEIAGSLPYLSHLTLRNAPNVTDRAITAIAGQPQLTHLALIDMQITGQSVKQMATMELLETLDLRMCQGIHGDALASTCGCPQAYRAQSRRPRD